MYICAITYNYFFSFLYVCCCCLSVSMGQIACCAKERLPPLIIRIHDPTDTNTRSTIITDTINPVRLSSTYHIHINNKQSNNNDDNHNKAIHLSTDEAFHLPGALFESSSDSSHSNANDSNSIDQPSKKQKNKPDTPTVCFRQHYSDPERYCRTTHMSSVEEETQLPIAAQDMLINKVNGRSLSVCEQLQGRICDESKQRQDSLYPSDARQLNSNTIFQFLHSSSLVKD